MKVKRINAGIYAISVGARRFEAEDFARENGGAPDWQLFEITGSGNREWWNDFPTLAACKAAVAKNV